ncbi:MAG: LptF/LptG family permease [Bacteroidota bacterium]
MKKLHLYILRQYFGPFLATFFISLFILLMQFLWKYIDDLVGKGLEWQVIIQLLFYASSTFVPLAVPLAVLLSSLMLFGNLGERYELVAMKSAGISLGKIMAPLFIFVFFLSVIVFFFSNNVLPIANLKFQSLLFDVREQKPALSIQEGVFNSSIENYVIRVAKKDRDNQTIYDVLIYDHSKRMGNTTVTRAEWGKMVMTEDKKYLIFTLYNGFITDEDPKRGVYNLIRPVTRIKFAENQKRMDLRSFSMNKTNEDFFKKNYQMLDIEQLDYAIDSLKGVVYKQKSFFANTLVTNFYYLNNFYDTINRFSGEQIASVDPNPMVGLEEAEKNVSVDFAIHAARNQKENIEFNKQDYIMQQKTVWKYEIEWHRKFSLSLACFVLFLIGAPLGSIIRKGGLGFPMVFSVFVFILFWIINITGEKFAREGVMPASIGMWMSTAILLPLGLFLLWKAATDSQLLDSESWQKWINMLQKGRKMFKKA